MIALKRINNRINNLENQIPNIRKEELKDIKLNTLTKGKIFRCVNEYERNKLLHINSIGENFYYFKWLYLKYKDKLPTVKLNPEYEKICRSIDRAKTPQDKIKIRKRINQLKKNHST